MTNRRAGSVAPLLAVALSFAAGACSTSPSAGYLARYEPTNTRSSFRVCSDFGCARDTVVAISDTEWEGVRSLFAGEPASSAEEREHIRAAIAMLETIVGPKAKTTGDEPGAPLFAFDTFGQMDCIDEAYNTSTYLRLLAADGLLRRHAVGQPALRGHMIDRWPHNTATVIETESGERFAVDSWFHGNGDAPEIVALSTWLTGWSPEHR